MACTLLSCAQCCSIFSLAGLIFLIIIGSLLQSQPLYIKGPEDPDKAAQGCYQGALIYLATFCFSVIYWILDTLKKKAVAALNSSSSNAAAPSPRTRTQGSKKYGALETD
eukprot:gene26570-32111_t